MSVSAGSLSTRPGKVLAGQTIVKFALFATYAAMSAVLLPARVAELDPLGKVATLAAITSIGFVVTAVTQPIVGGLSDRTRTRLGRRLPWMIAGAIVGGLAVGLIGDAQLLVVLALLWVVVQLALHGLEVSMDAYLVDAFPPSRRGRAAGVVGLALVAGTAAGAILSGALAHRPGTAFWILAGAIVLAVTVFALLVRDAPAPLPDRPRQRPQTQIRDAAATVAKHPDFIKILLWRIGYSIAYGTVFAYLLYYLTDLVGVPELEAARLIALATVLGSVATAISVVGGGWLSDRLRRRRLFILVGNVAIVAGDLLLLAWPSVSAVLVTALLLGTGFGLSISCGRALASQVLPDPAGGAAAGLGLLSTAANVGQAAAPVIGALAIGLGGYPAAFVASIAGAVGGSVAVALVRSVR